MFEFFGFGKKPTTIINHIATELKQGEALNKSQYDLVARDYHPSQYRYEIHERRTIQTESKDGSPRTRMTSSAVASIICDQDTAEWLERKLNT